MIAVGAVANMQFTYSFPSGFTFLYLVQLDATVEDDDYTPGSPKRADTWAQWSRWKRVSICSDSLGVIFELTTWFVLFRAFSVVARPA